MAGAPILLDVPVFKHLCRVVVRKAGEAIVQLHPRLGPFHNGFAPGARQLQTNRLVCAVVVHHIKGAVRTAFKFHPSLGCVLHRNIRVRAVGQAGLYACHRTADEPAHQVQRMDGLVDDDAAALFIPGAFPVALGIIFR